MLPHLILQHFYALSPPLQFPTKCIHFTFPFLPWEMSPYGKTSASSLRQSRSRLQPSFPCHYLHSFMYFWCVPHSGHEEGQIWLTTVLSVSHFQTLSLPQRRSSRYRERETHWNEPLPWMELPQHQPVTRALQPEPEDDDREGKLALQKKTTTNLGREVKMETFLLTLTAKAAFTYMKTKTRFCLLQIWISLRSLPRRWEGMQNQNPFSFTVSWFSVYTLLCITQHFVCSLTKWLHIFKQGHSN